MNNKEKIDLAQWAMDYTLKSCSDKILYNFKIKFSIFFYR